MKKKTLLEIIARSLPAKVDTATSETLAPAGTPDINKDSKSRAVPVDPVFKEIIPQYLKDIKNDVQYMTDALGKDDFESIRLKAHNIKGAGGGFGFNEISRIGKSIEDAAKAGNTRNTEKRINELSIYMTELKVVYR